MVFGSIDFSMYLCIIGCNPHRNDMNNDVIRQG